MYLQVRRPISFHSSKCCSLFFFFFFFFFFSFFLQTRALLDLIHIVSVWKQK